MARLPVLELTTHPSPNASVIWLHGLGADGHDFVPIVKELHLPQSMAVRFIFPHAPMQPVSINNGMVMRAWYDIATENELPCRDLSGSASRPDRVSRKYKANLAPVVGIEPTLQP